jgi:flagellar hook-basal body complex protein FliE
MTSPISAIGAISGVTGISAPLAPTSAAAVSGSGGTSFASMLAQGLQSVQASQTNADSLAVKVADGTLSDPAQFTMAATEAQLALQLVTALRNKAVDAFQEIMRMQA